MFLKPAIILLAFLFQLFPAALPGQSPLVGVIDFYGLRSVPEKEIRNRTGLREGDSVSRIIGDSILRKLEAIPGVKKGYLATVCCDEKTGQSILYIGIEEKEVPVFPYHPAPDSPLVLPAEIVDAYNDFFNRMVEGMQRGISGEDRSRGHALSAYPPARQVQQKFITYAGLHLPLLKEVTRKGANAEQRAIAAYVMAYARDKNQVIDDLLYSVYDSDDHVRNNATRALALIAGYAEKNPGKKIKKIPAAPFIGMLNSIVWSDRNKGVAVLLPLTENRDSSLLTQLRKEALYPILDMAQWKSAGHALMGYLLAGRLAGQPDDKIFKAFNSSERKQFLDACIIKINATR